MMLKDLMEELVRIQVRKHLACEVRVMLVDWTDDMTPVEVGVERVELVAGWRLVIYPEPLPT